MGWYMKAEKHIELSALRIFSILADSQTLTHAAERLAITQSAVSQALKQIETQVGSELIVRRSRPILLTPVGNVLKEYADRILSESRRMLSAMAMASQNGSAHLGIGMIDSFGEAAGHRLLERLQPYASQLALRVGLVSPLSKALLEYDLDLLITSDPMLDNPELERHPLLRDPFVMLVPESIPVEETASIANLAAKYPFVRYNRQARLGILTDVIARRLGIELNAPFELDSTQTLLRFVQAGRGWAFTTGLCVLQHPNLLEGIRVLPVSQGANARYITLLARHREMGELPSQVARICRDICDNELIPRITQIAPCIAGQIYSITEMPII